jgi:4'-phosphopantetheinyl transferase
VRPFRTPREHHVHLFSLERLARHGEQEALSLLDGAELEALGRAKAPQRRRELLFGRATLRRLLASYAGAGAGEVLIWRDANAKPRARLEDCRPVPSFNVSHSGDVLAIALCRHGDIGVDVEQTDGRLAIDLEGIARSQFAQAEYAVLMRSPPQQRLEAFYRIWTLKEAILKATGVGLYHPLNQIDVAEPARRYAVVLRSPTGEIGVAARHLLPGAGNLHVAVARQGAIGVVRLFDRRVTASADDARPADAPAP